MFGQFPGASNQISGFLNLAFVGVQVVQLTHEQVGVFWFQIKIGQVKAGFDFSIFKHHLRLMHLVCVRLGH